MGALMEQEDEALRGGAEYSVATELREVRQDALAGGEVEEAAVVANAGFLGEDEPLPRVEAAVQGVIRRRRRAAPPPRLAHGPEADVVSHIVGEDALGDEPRRPFTEIRQSVPSTDSDSNKGIRSEDSLGRGGGGPSAVPVRARFAPQLHQDDGAAEQGRRRLTLLRFAPLVKGICVEEKEQHQQASWVLDRFAPPPPPPGRRWLVHPIFCLYHRRPGSGGDRVEWPKWALNQLAMRRLAGVWGWGFLAVRLGGNATGGWVPTIYSPSGLRLRLLLDYVSDYVSASILKSGHLGNTYLMEVYIKRLSI